MEVNKKFGTCKTKLFLRNNITTVIFGRSAAFSPSTMSPDDKELGELTRELAEKEAKLEDLRVSCRSSQWSR